MGRDAEPARRLGALVGSGGRRGKSSQQLTDGTTRERIDQARCDGGQWLQDEATLPKPGVRHVEIGRPERQLPHQDEVQIERARRPRVGSLPSARPFDPHEGGEQHRRLQGAPADNRPVEVRRLRWNVDGSSLDERRYPHVGKQLAERGNREG